MVIRMTPPVRSAAVNAVTALANAGSGPATIEVYTGDQPATAATSPTGTLLATFTLEDPAYATTTTGSADIDAAPDIYTTGVANGTAGWARLADSDGNSIFDDLCATDNSTTFTLNTLVVTVGQTLTLTDGTFSVPSGE